MHFIGFVDLNRKAWNQLVEKVFSYFPLPYTSTNFTQERWANTFCIIWRCNPLQVWELLQLVTNILGTHNKAGFLWELWHTIFRMCKKYALWEKRKVMGSLLPEYGVLTHSLRCLNLTFNSWDDSGQILLEVKFMQSSWKGEKWLRSIMAKLMRGLMTWWWQQGQASKIAFEWFIPVTVKPIDNSRRLIKYQPLGKYHKFFLALCWEFYIFKQRLDCFLVRPSLQPWILYDISLLLLFFLSLSPPLSWFEIEKEKTKEEIEGEE